MATEHHICAHAAMAAHIDGGLDAVVTECLAHHRTDGKVGDVVVVHHLMRGKRGVTRSLRVCGK